MDIAESHGLAIDKIFAVSDAVIASGNGDLIVFRKGCDLAAILGIVKRNGNLGVSHRTALLRACKDNVFHLTASNILRGHFTEDPTHRIGDIRFSASVWSDDHGDTAIKGDDRFIGKRFEPLQFKRFESHESLTVPF